jgi:transcriptional regulator with XRE-family HTH domain
VPRIRRRLALGVIARRARHQGRAVLADLDRLVLRPAAAHLEAAARDSIRAARALLGWKQTDLAARSGVSEISIKNLERGATDARGSTLAKIQSAFEAAGLEIIPDGATSLDGGAGIRFRKRPSRSALASRRRSRSSGRIDVGLRDDALGDEGVDEPCRCRTRQCPLCPPESDIGVGRRHVRYGPQAGMANHSIVSSDSTQPTKGGQGQAWAA